MQISNETIKVLKNFSGINSSIYIDGPEIKTISNAKTVIGSYKSTEKFKKPFGIFDLTQLLSTLSLFDEPNVKFNKDYLEISSGNNTVKYRYCAENLILKAPEKDIKLPDILVEFDLSEKVLTDTLKAADVLNCKEWCIRSDNGQLKVVVCDVSDSAVNTFESIVGECDKDIDVVIAKENIQLIPDDYHVQISSKTISKFKSETMTYWIATQTRLK